jgi:hypothetical protein
MKHLIYESELGSLYLVGRVHSDLKRPVLFAMGGIWTPDENLHEVADWFQGATVLVAPLPGMSSTLTRNFDLTAAAKVADNLLGDIVGNRNVVAFGVSTGCLVTLGMRSPQVVRHVVLEPFFRTAPLWPFLASARKMLAEAPERLGAYQAAEAIFGIKGEVTTDLDYRHLLDGLTVPVDAILGDAPLEPERAFDGWPSLTSAEDRALLAAHPQVTTHRGPPGSGHYLQGTPAGEEQVKKVLHQALRHAMNDGPHGQRSN